MEPRHLAAARIIPQPRRSGPTGFLGAADRRRARRLRHRLQELEHHRSLPAPGARLRGSRGVRPARRHREHRTESLRLASRPGDRARPGPLPPDHRASSSPFSWRSLEPRIAPPCGLQQARKDQGSQRPGPLVPRHFRRARHSTTPRSGWQRRRAADALYAVFVLGNILYNGSALLVFPDLFGMHWFYLVSVPILVSNVAYVLFVMKLLDIELASHPRLARLGLSLASLLRRVSLVGVRRPRWPRSSSTERALRSSRATGWFPPWCGAGRAARPPRGSTSSRSGRSSSLL